MQSHNGAPKPNVSPEDLIPNMEDSKEDQSEEEDVRTSDVDTILPPVPPDVIVSNRKYRSRRWGPRETQSSLPADQYFTPPESVVPLFNLIDKGTYKTVFEPCCGKNHIVKLLEEHGFEVIARDKFTMEISHDYLIEEDPEYDVLITNPPFASKYEFLEKAYQTKKPFAMLLPFDTLTSKRGHDIFQKYGVAVGVFYKRVEFEREDESKVNTCPTAWFFGNFPFSPNEYPFFRSFYLKM